MGVRKQQQQQLQQKLLQIFSLKQPQQEQKEREQSDNKAAAIEEKEQKQREKKCSYKEGNGVEKQEEAEAAASIQQALRLSRCLGQSEKRKWAAKGEEKKENNLELERNEEEKEEAAATAKAHSPASVEVKRSDAAINNQNEHEIQREARKEATKAGPTTNDKATATTKPPPKKLQTTTTTNTTTETLRTKTKQKFYEQQKWRRSTAAAKLQQTCKNIAKTILFGTATTTTETTTKLKQQTNRRQQLQANFCGFLLFWLVMATATRTCITTAAGNNLNNNSKGFAGTTTMTSAALGIFASMSLTTTMPFSTTLLLFCATLSTTALQGVSGATVNRLATTSTLATMKLQQLEQQEEPKQLPDYHYDEELLALSLSERQPSTDDAGGSSNEQQLLQYYERAQEQQDAQYYRPETPLDFDELPITVAEIVSTLSPAKVDYAIEHESNSRRATKRAATLPQAITKANTLSSTTAATSSNSISSTTSTLINSANDEPTSSLTSLALKLTGSTKEPKVADGVATAALNNATSTAATLKEKCEPKVLDEVPTEPFYDFTDIAEDAARQFTEFLSTKFGSNPPKPITDQMREEVRRRANGIASYALNEDDNLLAFAIAAPSIHTVVVKFRDNVTIPPQEVHNKGFLGSYWRELGYAWNSTDGTQEWGAPFRDCNLLVGRWLWPFRISFSEAKIRIVAAAFIAADEDVCNDGLEEIFGRRHGCDNNTTFCLLTGDKPAATRDVYTCICREGFYLPNSTLQGFRGDIVEQSEGNYSCIPCPSGCTNCGLTGDCSLAETEETVSIEYLLNVIVSTVLGSCILCCNALMWIVFRQRKSKAIASGMWLVLETILLGIALLYVSVSVHLYPASTWRCLLEPWLRELGFIICYGAIILKLYRHLVDFRTRKAHRLVLRDVDLLKYLSVMVVAVICYMAAFTASSYDLLQIAQLESLREINTNTCRPLSWEYVTQASEICILAFGLQLAIASRNANTQYRERQFLVSALAVEFVFSTTYYVLRFLYLDELSPGAIFLALFLRSQLTNTVCLALVFVPKLWYQHKQVQSLAYDLSIRLPVDAFKGSSHDAGQRLGGGYAGLCLGDPDIGELTIAEMSPEDIRAELKRLYTQLEVLKNKSLRQDNPHISKRRGGRKAGHRRFSLQKKGSKDKALSAKHRSHKHHQDIEITEAEPSRTPEDSVCSNEGPTDTFAEISGISHSMLSHSAVSHSVVSQSK